MQSESKKNSESATMAEILKQSEFQHLVKKKMSVCVCDSIKREENLSYQKHFDKNT